jgi:HEAT repeat protein
VRAKVWPLLQETASSRNVMMRTATMVTVGRVGAVSPGFAAAARKRLFEALSDPDRRVVRAAIRGLVHVADSATALPLHREASGDRPHDVRGFLTLALSSRPNAAADALLVSLWKGDEGGNFEISTLAALGHTTGGAGDRLLRDVLGDARMRPSLRGTAATSIARRGGPDALPLLLAALDDRHVEVRRAAAMGLGVLDWRTAAEREIAALRDEAGRRDAPAPDFSDRLAVLGALVESQRDAMDGVVEKAVRRLAKAVDRDRDRFTRSMALVSIGRIARETDSGVGHGVLEREHARGRHAQREFALLALALARAPEAGPLALAELAKAGNAPTTRGAAAVALGLLGDASADAALLAAMAEDAHPTIRGYAALALGMIGTESSSAPLRAFFATARSPEAIGWGALGLALLGRRQDGDLFVKRLSEGANDVIGWNLVHALRLHGDRSSLPSLLALARDGRTDVSELAVLAIGYVLSRDPWPHRIRMSRGYDYTLRHLTLDAYYFTL